MVAVSGIFQTAAGKRLRARNTKCHWSVCRTSTLFATLILFPRATLIEAHRLTLPTLSFPSASPKKSGYKDTATSVLNNYVHVKEYGPSKKKRVEFYVPMKLAKKVKQAQLALAKKGKKRA